MYIHMDTAPIKSGAEEISEVTPTICKKQF